MTKPILGIDVGGTFTDLVLVLPDGSARIHKVLNVDSGALSAVRGARELVEDASAVSTIVHGTTVATNAVLERRGSATVLVTTTGFRDVLEFQRQDRTDVWDLFWTKTAPLVPRALRMEVDERLSADGAVVRAIDASAAADAVLALVDEASADSVAICFLHAYRNGVHEAMLADAIAQHRPGLHVSQSHKVVAAYREYDRMSTTVLNAYLGPVIAVHTDKIVQALLEAGFTADVLVMQSHGGVVPISAAGGSAAALCLSGPAGGVLAASHVASVVGISDVICLDMGGTSTDVAMVRAGRPEITYDSTIDGLPSMLPTFRIETVGAGGGSIISVDEGGLIQSGPSSAGAVPGPACYGRGGSNATVTDAWCALGVLLDDGYPNRYLTLDSAAACAVFEHVAARLSTSVEESAWQALRVTTANMSRALRLVSVEQGHDPRDFVLTCYGGAGGLHAAMCADELGMRRVLVPVAPGVFSAYGMVCADVTRHYVRTRIALVERAAEVAQPLIDEMRAMALDEFVEFGFATPPEIRVVVDLRYVGQAHEVQVGIEAGELDSIAIRTAFDEAHSKRFGFCETTTPVEIVNVRLEAVLVLPTPELRDESTSGEAPTQKKAYFGAWMDTTFVQRSAIESDAVVLGPAVITESTATTVVPPGWNANRDEMGNLWLNRL